MNANKNLNTLHWLIRREFWENKGSMFWAPVIVGTLMVFFIAGTAIWASSTGAATAYHTLDHSKQVSIAQSLAFAYLILSTPLFLMLSVIVFFYCLAALHDERRDRSILFWKSLPLSDASTVLSKVAVATCLAPAITFVVATVTSLILLFIGALMFAFYGNNLFGMLLSTPQLYLAPLQLLALLPVYALWALPTVGYLLMVSAWARSKVVLWAAGTPLMIVVVVKWTDFLSDGRGLKAEWFTEHIVARCLGSVLPGGWLAGHNVQAEKFLLAGTKTFDLSLVVKHSYLAMSDPGFWIGVAAGVAMIYVAIRLRRWKDEG